MAAYYGSSTTVWQFLYPKYVNLKELSSTQQ